MARSTSGTAAPAQKHCAPLKHKSRVTSVQFSPGGRHLLTTSEGQAHLWNLATAREVFPPRQHEYHFVESHMDEYLKMFARFSPDGKRIATASGFTARVWDAETGTAVLEPLKHPSWVEHVEFSRDGSKLVTTCADRGVRVWDAATGIQLSEPMQVRSEYIFSFSAQFSPDGKWIVATTPGRFSIPPGVDGLGNAQRLLSSSRIVSRPGRGAGRSNGWTKRGCRDRCHGRTC